MKRKAECPDGCNMNTEKYRTVLADPPWPYSSPRAIVGNGGRGKPKKTIIQADVTQHYKVMTLQEIADLPVEKIVKHNSHLYLWTTNSFICEAHQIARAWGFIPKTIITWGKIRKADRQSFEPSCKTGYWYRSATEHCLFAVRGKLRLKQMEAVPTLFLEERLPHSRKPDSFRMQIERLSPGPFVELFARSLIHGWDVWGDEVQGASAFVSGVLSPTPRLA